MGEFAIIIAFREALISNFKRGKYWCEFFFKLFLFLKKCKNEAKNLFKERIYWKKKIFFRSSRSRVFFGKRVLKICSILTGERSCWSASSIKLLCRTPFSQNPSGRPLLFFFLWKDHSQMKQIFIVEQIYIKYPNTFWTDKIWSGSAEVAHCCFLYFYFILVFFFLWDYTGGISETNKPIHCNEHSRFSKEVN